MDNTLFDEINSTLSLAKALEKKLFNVPKEDRKEPLVLSNDNIMSAIILLKEARKKLVRCIQAVEKLGNPFGNNNS